MSLYIANLKLFLHPQKVNNICNNHKQDTKIHYLFICTECGDANQLSGWGLGSVVTQTILVTLDNCGWISDSVSCYLSDICGINELEIRTIFPFFTQFCFVFH